MVLCGSESSLDQFNLVRQYCCALRLEHNMIVVTEFMKGQGRIKYMAGYNQETCKTSK